MCEICQTYQPDVLLVNNAEYRVDPTRTTTLRNLFAQQMNTRFNKVASAVKHAIVDLDVLALKQLTVQQLMNRQFDFPTNDRKIEEFMRWLDELIGAELLTVLQARGLGQSIHPQWTDLYVEDSYKRGVIRARSEMRKSGMDIPSMEDTGGIRASMGTPFHMDRVGILYIRTFEELKGITSQMSTLISRTLAQGLMDGDNPKLIASKLVKVIADVGDLSLTDSLGRFVPAKRRAQIMARTEIIRAHHRGMIQEYRNWGLHGVYVMAEFRTAGDKRVCSICDSMQGNKYTLDEAEGIIPVHPQCRCMVLPYETK